jgi:heme-degrading monooxygenase HmoA
MFASTPEPPYTAVVFTSRRTEDDDGYEAASASMLQLAAAQPGFLGVESARDPTTRLGITVSYWSSPDDARAWGSVAEHVWVQGVGRERWYERYVVRIATVDRTYGTAVDV